MQPLRRGHTGSAVAEVRRILASLGLLGNTDISVVGVFDESTDIAVRHFQQTRGLSVDGLVGTETYAALNAARWRLGDRVLQHTPGNPLVGDDVSALQKQLRELGYDVGRQDRLFARATEEALRAFQKESGLRVDGICGPGTLRALKRLARHVMGGHPQNLRDIVAVASAGPHLPGKRIVIDPAHGGSDDGVAYGNATEADLVWDIATRLEGRLQALGVTALLTRGPATGASESERADFANNVDADLLLSLHVDAVDTPRANGISAYYYGTSGSASWIGERLADLALREITARTGMLNVRAHAKTWTLLRLTRMPAVRLEVGYMSSPRDRAMLTDSRFRDTVAEGLLIAIQRLYLPAEADPPTGVMKISAVVS
jgi:N-acetylmuramoyl-L-alanine amidase